MNEAGGTRASPAEPGKIRSDIVWILAICATGAAVRLAFLADWARLELFRTLSGDELNFHLTALAILNGTGDVGTFLYQPLVSFFLVVVYGLFGVDLQMVHQLQFVLGMINILVFYGLGRELGGRRVARFCALLAGLYGPFVFFESQILAPALTVPLTAGALWSLLHAGKSRRVGWLALSGLLAGLVLMGRPNMILVAGGGLVWWWLQQDRWRPRLIGLGLATLGLAIGLSPAWIHNLRQGQGWIPVSASGGHSFYIGNNAQATGAYALPRDLPVDDTGHQVYLDSWRILAERAEGRPLELSEVSSYWFRRGLKFWIDQPGRALGLMGRKLLLTLNSAETPIHHPYVVGLELTGVLGFLPTFGLVFPFAVLGAWLGRRRRLAGVGLLVLSAAICAGGLVVFYVADRYRILMLPMLLPLAACGMSFLIDRFREKGFSRAWPELLLLLGAFAVTQPDLQPESARVRALVGAYNLMGKSLGDRGDLVEAEAWFRKGIALAGPDHGAVVRTNLGLLLLKRGDTAGALDSFRQAARVDSRYRFVRLQLARLAEARGDLAAAIRWWQEVADLSADPGPALRAIERLQARQREQRTPEIPK